MNGLKKMNNSFNWLNFFNPTDDWYYLTDKERKKYLVNYLKIVEATKKKGAKLIGSYKCRSNSEWARYDIWEFPSIEIIVEMNNELEEIGHFQFFEENHVLGRKYRKFNKDSETSF